MPPAPPTAAHVAADALLSPTVEPGPFSRILSRVAVGAGSTIGAGAHLEPDSCVGEQCEIGAGAFIGHGARVESRARIGANATIAPRIVVGLGAIVEAGAAVTRAVPPRAIVTGNPAHISGYADTGSLTRTIVPLTGASQRRNTRIPGVALHELPAFNDLRGDLVVADFRANLPFEPKRHFIVHRVTSGEIRGEHAHRTCHQFLYAIAGSCRVVADDGREREEFVLDRPSLGLHLPPRIWATQYRYTADAVLGVYASHTYSPEDYIRDYQQFLAEVAR